jgi:TetR/AcrR family transcriptional regulator, transcriptional repressor for nem operon
LQIRPIGLFLPEMPVTHPACSIAMTKAERTRQFIIEKSAPILNSKGIAGTSISDIMEATQLAKGGIYGNFATKDEITVEAFDYMLNAIKEKVNSVAAAAPTAREKLFVILEFYRQYPGEPTMVGGCPILNFGVESDDTNPVIKKRVSDAIDYFQESIERVIRSGIKKGEFRADWDVPAFVIRMFAMLEGGILIGRIQNSNKPMCVLIDSLQKEISGYLL